MKRTFALAGVLSFLGLSGLCAQTDQRVWTLGGLEEKNADSIYLGYGVPESDDSLGSFTCAPGSGLVKIWIAETSDKLKAGDKATAILSVGEKTAKVAGKLVPNEEAGVPSFEGRLPAKDPIFAAMVRRGNARHRHRRGEAHGAPRRRDGEIQEIRRGLRQALKPRFLRRSPLN